MKKYSGRLSAIENKIPKDTRVIIVFSREGSDVLYHDPAYTRPVEDDAEYYTSKENRINVLFNSVDGSKQHRIIDDI